MLCRLLTKLPPVMLKPKLPKAKRAQKPKLPKTKVAKLLLKLAKKLQLKKQKNKHASRY